MVRYVEITVTKEKGLVQNVMLQPLSTVDYENDYSDSKKTWDNLAGNTSSTTISVADEAIKVKFPGGHANVYETAAPRFKNGVVEMDITPEKSGKRLGILLRANGMDDRIYVGVGDAENQWFAEYWGNGSNSWSDMYNGPTASAGKTLHLKAEIIDTTISLWVDGKLVFDKVDMGGMPTKAGFVGLNTRNANNVTIDNVKVTSYDLPVGEVETVAGHVSDKDGNVLEGVSINIKSAEGAAEAVDKTTKTDALGNYKFKNIPLGKYKVVATNDKKTKTVNVTVEATDKYIVAPEICFGVVTDGWNETTDGWEYYEDGKKVTGWKDVDGTWYYFSENGIMATGWVDVNGTWYYMKDVNGTWYYMNNSGAMETGWVDVNGTWYYMNNSGAMCTGWVNVNGTWYYMHADGSMAASEWVYVGDEWYYMHADGSMATSQWIDGCFVGASGKIV